LRRACQLWVMCTAYRRADRSVLPVSLDQVTWLPPRCHRRRQRQRLFQSEQTVSSEELRKIPSQELSCGVWISARSIFNDHLTPAMHFATMTMIPHLAFEDRYFDLIFCGSVFTHIEDIQQSWLLELGRVLRPSGRLFITVHDEYAVKHFDASYLDYRTAKYIQEQPVHASNKNNSSMIVVGRGAASQVFYNSHYLKALKGYFAPLLALGFTYARRLRLPIGSGPGKAVN
jgi:SAM-dependent methyltransferase